MYDPEALDLAKRDRLEGDDNISHITAYQAQKCAAILDAYIDGQSLYRESVNTVAQFLKTAALEAALGRGVSRPSAQSIWGKLDELAWPRHGSSQPQAE